MAKVMNYAKEKIGTLFGLLQNEALSVIAIHSFVLGYNNIARNKEGVIAYPRLQYLFYVLPIVYNMANMNSFLNSTELYTAIMKEPNVILGLQERANKMSVQTFDAINIGFSKKIFDIDKNDFTIFLLRPFTSKKLPLSMSSFKTFDSVKKIQDSAYRLGSIFAKRHDKNIQNDLNIRF